jgi:hypothetical protein
MGLRPPPAPQRPYVYKPSGVIHITPTQLLPLSLSSPILSQPSGRPATFWGDGRVLELWKTALPPLAARVRHRREKEPKKSSKAR